MGGAQKEANNWKSAKGGLRSDTIIPQREGDGRRYKVGREGWYGVLQRVLQKVSSVRSNRATPCCSSQMMCENGRISSRVDMGQRRVRAFKLKKVQKSDTMIETKAVQLTK